MTQAFDWSWLRRAVDVPAVTLDMYTKIPEDLGKRIEVVDGRVIGCESPSPSHQAIQHNLVAALRGPVKEVDARDDTCHKVIGDIDMLLTEVPRFHYRRPDVLVYRCVDQDRGKWRRKPYASDAVLVIEIVSPDSVVTDTRDKMAEYAAIGIPHYWIVTMAGHEGVAVSVERFRLGIGREYVPAGGALRDKDLHAVDTVDPFRVQVTWDELDAGV